MVVSELSQYKLAIEFTNAEGSDIKQYIKDKITFSIDKVYQAEYEKELKELEIANDAAKNKDKQM